VLADRAEPVLGSFNRHDRDGDDQGHQREERSPTV